MTETQFVPTESASEPPSNALPTRASPATPRWLALGAIAGPVVFSLAWVVLGFLSPGFTTFGITIEPYSPVSHPVSGLGLGPTGPYMNAAFILSGLLLVAGVIGVFQTLGPIGTPAARWTCVALLGLAGVGLVIDGIFTFEAFLPHMIGVLLGAGAPVLSFPVAGRFLRRIPGWRRFGTWLFLGSPLTLGLLVLTLVTFDIAAIAAGEGIAGLTERALIIEVSAWFVAMGWLGFRTARLHPHVERVGAGQPLHSSR